MSFDVAPQTLTVFLGPIPLGELFDRPFQDFQRQGQTNPDLLTEHKWWQIERGLAESLEEEGPTGQRLIDQVLSIAIGFDVMLRTFDYKVAYHREHWVASVQFNSEAVHSVRGDRVDTVFESGRAKRIAAMLGLILARQWTSYIVGVLPAVTVGVPA